MSIKNEKKMKYDDKNARNKIEMLTQPSKAERDNNKYHIWNIYEHFYNKYQHID